jgi:hypothetical protein
MQRSTAWAGIGLAVVALSASPASADDRLKMNLILEGRLVTTPPSTSFLDGGLGKTRYGRTPRTIQARLAQAVLLGRFEPRPDLVLNVHANFDAEHNFTRRLDLVESALRYTPALGDTLTLDVRAGLFFPSISLENTSPGWLSPYTTSFSAINSWIGEEVRSLGVEAGPSLRMGEAQIRAFGAVARQNDPNGTLLAWRGFALHDRITTLGDRLPLPALRSFGRPDLFPEQPRYVEPLREVDRRWTWSTGLAVSHPKHRLRAVYQAPTADPGAFDGKQYAWRTRFWSLGVSRFLGPVELLFQGLDGETRMGITSRHRNVVIAGFRSAYGLASWMPAADSRHRATVRYDYFRVQDRDEFVIEDSNDETGRAWTFAYSFSPVARHRITLEALHVQSTRANRLDLGLAKRSTEILGSLSWRLTF